jgi:hypothetical protein
LNWEVIKILYLHTGLTPAEVAAGRISTKYIDLQVHAVVGYDLQSGFYGEVLCRARLAGSGMGATGIPDLSFKFCEKYNLREQRALDDQGRPIPHRIPLTYSQAMACRKRMINSALNYGFGGDTDLPTAW